MIAANRIRRLMLARIAALTVLTFIAFGFTAQPAAAETTLEVTTPAEGRFQPGTTPLIVTIEADRAIAGTLNARFDGFPAGSQRVEVPGGSAKEIVFIVDVPPWSQNGSVSFDADDSDDDATAQVDLVPPGGDELVAVLPELAARDLPASADLASDIGVARLFALDVDLLDAGSGVLGPFNQLLATKTDLESLDGSRLAAVETWVGSDGGILVVDEEPGTTIPFEALVDPSGENNSVGFGLGLVVFSGGRAGDGRYDGLLRPTPSRSPGEFPWGGEFGGGFPSTSILASDAGVTIPAIGSIVLVLVAYAVVVGPILWFVLRRSRREPMLWLALPAVALATTAGIYVVGQALRDESSTAHATIYADLPTQQLVASQVLVTAPNGGTAGVRLPDGWRPARVSTSEEMFFEGPFGGGGGGLSTASPELRGNDLSLDLPPGGLGVIGAESVGPTGDPSWEFVFAADEAELVGTITNLTAHDLEEVVVSSGQGFSRISEVEAGETVDVTLRDVDQPPINGDRLMESFWNFDGFSDRGEGVMNPGILISWLSARPQLRSPGFITIIGWTRDETSPLVTSRGDVVEDGRTAFITADRLDEAVISSDRGRTEFLRGWGSTNVADPINRNECSDFPLTMRTTPGPGVIDDDPTLALSTRAIAGLDVWDGAIWQPAGMAEAPAGDLAISIPATAFEDGSVYLRVQMSCEFWGMSDPFPLVRSALPDDDILEIGALGVAQDDIESQQEDQDTPDQDEEASG